MLVRAFHLASQSNVVGARQCAEDAIDGLTEIIEVLNDAFPKIPK